MQRWLAYLLLIFSGILCYYPILWAPFATIDDHLYVTDNLRVRYGGSWQDLVWAFSSFFYGNWSPVTLASHMLDVRLFGLNAGGHHATSLFFHILNALLLYRFLKQLPVVKGVALLSATLFCISPVSVETAAWVSSRKDLLATFFLLLSLNFYLSYVRDFRRKYLYFSLLSFVFGLMAKSSLVCWPVLLFAIDWFARIQYPNKLKSILTKLPYFILAAAVLAVNVYAQSIANAVGTPGSRSILSMLVVIGLHYSFYLLEIFAPWMVTLVQSTSFLGPELGAFLSIGFYLLLIALVVWGRKNRLLVFGTLCFLIPLSLYLQIVQVGGQEVAMRWVYIAQVGVYLAFFGSLTPLVSKLSSRIAVQSALCAICFCLAIYTHSYVRLWTDLPALLKFKQSSRQDTFPAGLLALHYNKAGQWEQALEAYQHALDLHPLYSLAFEDYANLLKRKEKLEQLEVYYQKAKSAPISFPFDSYSLASIIEIYARFFGKTYLEEARAEVKKVVAQAPKYLDGLLLAVKIEFLRNDFKAAQDFMNLALALNPKNAKVQMWQGRLAEQKGEITRALEFYQQAMDRDVLLFEAQKFMALLLCKTGNQKAGAAYLDQLSEVDRISQDYQQLKFEQCS